MTSSASGDDDPSSSSSNEEDETQSDIPGVIAGVAAGGGKNKRKSTTDGGVTSNQQNSGDGDAPAVASVGGPQHSLIVEPRSHDVLLGRGRPYQNFSGNKRMLKIVSRYKDDYSARPRDQKRAFVDTVLDVVLKDGTRFLRRVDEGDGSGHWEEVDRTSAAEKVWHALRCKDRSGRQAKKRKASAGGDEVGSSTAAAAAAAAGGGAQLGQTQAQQPPPVPQPQPQSGSNHASSNSNGGGMMNNHHSSSSMSSSQPTNIQQMLQRQMSAVNMPDPHALLRDIQLHLANAVAAANLLAAIIGTPPAGGPPPSSNSVLGNAMAAAAAAAAAPTPPPTQSNSHEWLRNQQGNLPFPGAGNYASMAGLVPLSSFGNHHAAGLHGMIDPSTGARLSSASAQPQQQQSQPSSSQSSSDQQNQALLQALSTLMQARQQGSSFHQPP